MLRCAGCASSAQHDMEIALPRAVTLRGAEGGAKGLAVLTMSSPTP